ncbi:TonB-dependent receptor [Simiduia litorea]|uniref:TonB-dependent receptor n=1 Tax=Simiduia litorea TaxID=1435348 RepID=UPI0036F34918
MQKRSVFQRRFLTTAIVAAMAASAQVSIAQTQEGKSIEEVTVVGSRLSQGGQFEGATPVQVFDRDSIDKSGYTNLQQLFEKSPIAGNGTFSTRGNNQDSTANGASAVSLRGMGADATLVLVNGRRVAISAFAEGITTNFVDINALPVSAVERIEVLKDGASAIYGSDAVAGVVNVVMRDNFDGFDVSVGYGNTTDTDNSETTFSAIWGMNGDDDSNITLVFDYFKNTALMNADRGRLGTANQSANGGFDYRSSRGYPGNFTVDGVVTIDPGCPASNNADPTCVYDYGPWNVLTPAAERAGIIVSGHRNLTDGVEFFTEIAVQHNTSAARGAPTPLDGDAGLTVPVSHPNNPFTGATTIGINRYRTVDAGAREWDIETDNVRGVLGLRGKIADWDWELAAQRARSESTQTGSRSQGWVRTDLLQQEIDAGRYNPFGGVANPDSVIDAITTSLVRSGTSQLSSVEFNVDGELFALAGGNAAMAAGLEYREESASDTPDDQFQRGLIFGTESVSASGNRDISSAYVEFALPVTDSINISLAGRHDSYSDFGSTTNPMANIRWAPMDSLAFRASWGTGFRAPSLAQVGLGPSQESLFLTDDYGCAVNIAYCANTDYTVVFAGNPNLEPEESESANIGVVFNPTDALTLSLDYWNIKQEGKIDKVSIDYLYTQFCNDQNSDVCVRSTPLPGDSLGEITSINSGFINIGEQNVTGVDFSLLWADLEAMGGTVNLRLDYAFLVEFERVELNAAGDGFTSIDLAGKYKYPKHRWNVTGDWDLENFGLSATLNYIGSFDDLDGDTNYYIDATRTVDAMATVNLQARYTGLQNTLLSVGVNNLFDEDVPFASGDGDSDLYGYVSSQHDPRGQYVYGKVSYSF